MRGGERVVHVAVREGGELPGERVVVLLLLGMEPEILEEEDLARPERARARGGLRPDAVGGELDGVAEQCPEALGDGTHRVLRRLALGPVRLAALAAARSTVPLALAVVGQSGPCRAARH